MTSEVEPMISTAEALEIVKAALSAMQDSNRTIDDIVAECEKAITFKAVYAMEADSDLS